jgi:hypothetical protein
MANGNNSVMADQSTFIFAGIQKKIRKIELTLRSQAMRATPSIPFNWEDLALSS